MSKGIQNLLNKKSFCEYRSERKRDYSMLLSLAINIEFLSIANQISYQEKRQKSWSDYKYEASLTWELEDAIEQFNQVKNELAELQVCQVK